MAYFSRVQHLDSDGGTFALDPQGEDRSITYRAIPLTEPAVSIGFLRVEALSWFPNRDGKLWLQSVAVASDEHGHYLVTGQYGPKEPKEPLFSTYRASGGGRTANIKYSLSTISSHGPGGGEVPASKGVLGYDGETVRGIDAPVPGFSWQETHYLPQSIVTREYIGMLSQMRSKVNDAAWKGFAAGEAQFLDFSADATVRDAEDDQYTWQITYSFEGSPNETDIQIGEITIPTKEGWDHLEVRYSNLADTSGLVLPKPIAAYVERVFERTDFAALGIGT